MKVAIVLLPKNGEVNLSVSSAGRAPRYFLLGRRKHLLLCGALLICAIGVWFTTQLSTMAINAMAKPRFYPDPWSPSEQVTVVKIDESKTEIPQARGWLKRVLAKVTPEEPPPSRVLPFDGSRVLSRGAKVVVHFDGQSIVAEVAGAPNESVLLRRGHLPERLYVLGDSSYAVMANQKSKIVRASDIFATVAAPVEIARN